MIRMYDLTILLKLQGFVRDSLKYGWNTDLNVQTHAFSVFSDATFLLY